MQSGTVLQLITNIDDFVLNLALTNELLSLILQLCITRFQLERSTTILN